MFYVPTGSLVGTTTHIRACRVVAALLRFCGIEWHGQIKHPIIVSVWTDFGAFCTESPQNLHRDDLVVVVAIGAGVSY